MASIAVQSLDRADGSADAPDFSLVLGGPLYQLFRRAHLSGDTLELLHRRVIASVILGWVPLAILSVTLPPSIAVAIPFLRDCDAQARFLVALPLLVYAELIVHQRTVGVARQFLTRGIVTAEDLPRLRAAIAAATRVRNSVAMEIALLVLVYTVGQWHWRTQVALSTSTWYATVDTGGAWHLTAAGYWYAYFALPVFQFIVVRWYLRMLLWAWLLWRTSRLALRITATHPDRSGGLGFLGKCAYAFGPILFAQGALLSGLMGNEILYNGAKLVDFKMEALSMVAFFMIVVLGPLLVFAPKMLQAKRQALGEYGLFAMTYVRRFEDKWVRGHGDEAELLGTGDIQSLADLGNSYQVIREMRGVPFSWQDVTQLAVVTAAPLVPLALTMISFEELLGRLLRIVF